jgi:hypothetical protein
MDALLMTLHEAGFGAYLQLFALFGGSLWALICAVLLGLRWKLPPMVATFPLGMSALCAIAATLVATAGVHGNEQADPSVRATILASAIATPLALGTLTVCNVPVAALLGLGGLAAGIRAPRAWVIPILLTLFTSGVALLPLAGFAFGLPWWTVLGRVLVYGLGGWIVALASVNAHVRGNGPEGGMTAAVAYACVVVLGEIAASAFAWSDTFAHVAVSAPAERVVLLDRVTENAGYQRLVSWLTIVLAALPLLPTAFRRGPPLTEEEALSGLATPAPWRTLARWGAVGAWLLWVLAFIELDPVSGFAALAAAVAP